MSITSLTRLRELLGVLSGFGTVDSGSLAGTTARWFRRVRPLGGTVPAPVYDCAKRYLFQRSCTPRQRLLIIVRPCVHGRLLRFSVKSPCSASSTDAQRSTLGSSRTNQRFVKPAHGDDAQRDEHRQQRELSDHKGRLGLRRHARFQTGDLQE